MTMALFLLYFGFWWIYRLEDLPGLHADEAWSGLKAIHFKKINSVDQLSGMNYYTGILQALISDLTFRAFGIGVFQLRAGGAILNLLSILLLSSALLREANYKTMVIFLVIIAQSALFLISPRVAWEVNSLTSFFISLLFISLSKIARNKGDISHWCVLFLFTNILGTYNHIIFSCISVSAFFGLLFWTAIHKCGRYGNVLLLLTINLVNLIIVYLSMRYLVDSVLALFPYVLAFTSIVLLGETALYRHLISVKYLNMISVTFSPVLINGILILSLVSFLTFHGMAFLQTVSNYKIILQSYSREYSLIIQGIFIISGGSYVYYFFLCVCKGLRHPRYSVFAFMLLSYMGFLNFYTLDTSFRYYLALYACTSFYIAYYVGSYQVPSKKLVVGLVSGFIILNSVLLDIFFFDKKPLRAIEFNIGNGQIETSAHFLPKQPLLNFLEKNEIGEIIYLEKDFYFIQEPIKFYKLIDPWIEKRQNKAIIDFDFNGYKNGFMLHNER